MIVSVEYNPRDMEQKLGVDITQEPPLLALPVVT
jgi:hypothetical protein